MKTKYFLLSLVLLKVLTFSSYAHAQDDDDVSSSDDTFIPTSSENLPPVIIDESDSSSVSDVEEYDG